MFFMACVYMYSMKQESWVFLTCNFTPSSNLCLCTNFLPHHILKISSLSFISLSLPPSHTVSLLLSFSSSISVSLAHSLIDLLPNGCSGLRDHSFTATTYTHTFTLSWTHCYPCTYIYYIFSSTPASHSGKGLDTNKWTLPSFSLWMMLRSVTINTQYRTNPGTLLFCV